MFHIAALAIRPGLAIAGLAISGLVGRIAAWLALRATQRAIDGLGDHLLRDIGLEGKSSANALRRHLLLR